MLLGPGPLTFKMAAMPFEGPIDFYMLGNFENPKFVNNC